MVMQTLGERVGDLRAPRSLAQLRLIAPEGPGSLVAATGESFDVTQGIPLLIRGSDVSGFGPSPTAQEEAAFYDLADSAYEREAKQENQRILDDCREGAASGDIHAAQGWLDSTFEHSAQRRAYEYLEPIEGAAVLQIGGTGLHAVKFLLAGARFAATVTPFLQEAKLAAALACRYGVDDRHLAVVGLGEELPFRSEGFDRVYCGGSLHHLDCSLALPEIARVLIDGGRFGSIDPWRTPVYRIGIRVFGKREADVHCRPLDRDRVAAAADAFTRCEVSRFHPLLRYPLILQQRLPRHLGADRTRRLLELETAAERRLPRACRGHGSCVALTGQKGAA